jgi:hypothetical protein
MALEHKTQLQSQQSEKNKEIIKKYQNLKCWICGKNESNQMTICKCLSDPSRNDDFAKDGYSALCKTHEGRYGTSKAYSKLE